MLLSWSTRLRSLVQSWLSHAKNLLENLIFVTLKVVTRIDIVKIFHADRHRVIARLTSQIFGVFKCALCASSCQTFVRLHQFLS